MTETRLVGLVAVLAVAVFIAVTVGLVGYGVAHGITDWKGLAL